MSSDVLGVLFWRRLRAENGACRKAAT